MSSGIKRLTGFPPSIYILAAVVLWSTGGLFIKMTTISAFEVNAGRCLLAAVTVGLLTFRQGLKLNWFTILTSLLYAGTLSCFAIATKKTTAANAIFLQYTAPVYILLLAPVILKEKFKWTDLLTVVFCLAGMSLFFFDSFISRFLHESKIIYFTSLFALDTTPNAQLSADSQFEGNIYALVSGIFFGLYFILLRHPRSLRQNPTVSVFYGNLAAVLLMLPFILANPSAWTTQDFLAVGYLGVFQIGLAYFLFTYGISKGVRSLDASIIGFIEPLLNPIWVFFLLGEKPSNWAIFGGTIILAAIATHTILNAKVKAELAL